MGNGDKSTIIQPQGASVGKVDVAADFATGLAHLRITLPFSIEPIVCAVPLVDYLESAAHITIEMCALQRQMRAARS